MTDAEKIARLKKRMVVLRTEVGSKRSEIDRLRTRLTRVGMWQHERSEEGEWARHYSIASLTAPPLLFSAALAALVFKWDEGNPIVLGDAAALWVAGLFLLTIYTRRAYERMENEAWYSDKIFDASGVTRKPDAKPVAGNPSGKWERWLDKWKQPLDNLWPWNWARPWKWWRDPILRVGLFFTSGFLILVYTQVGHHDKRNNLEKIELASGSTIAIGMPPTMPTLKAKFDDPIPTITLVGPTTFPSLTFGAPPLMPVVEFNTPTTFPSVKIESANVPPPTNPEAAVQARSALSINDNQIVINPPRATAKRFHFLTLELFGVRFCDVSIPIQDGPPHRSNARSAGKTK